MRNWCIQTDVNGSLALVTRACWGWVFLTDVNGSIREADGVGGVCGGQRHPAPVRVLFVAVVHVREPVCPRRN